MPRQWSETFQILPRRNLLEAFETAIIINNFSHGNLRVTNCEYDNLELLTGMNEFLTGNEEAEELHDDKNLDKILKELEDEEENNNGYLERSISQGDRPSLPITYIAGFIVRRILKDKKMVEINQCQKCEMALKAKGEEPCHNLINNREYDEIKRSLKYPSRQLVETVGACLKFTYDFLEKQPYTQKLRETIIAS